MHIHFYHKFYFISIKLIIYNEWQKQLARLSQLVGGQQSSTQRNTQKPCNLSLISYLKVTPFLTKKCCKNFCKKLVILWLTLGNIEMGDVRRLMKVRAKTKISNYNILCQGFCFSQYIMRCCKKAEQMKMLLIIQLLYQGFQTYISAKILSISFLSHSLLQNAQNSSKLNLSGVIVSF